MTFQPTSKIYRLTYLDWLRFIVVLSLTPFHAAISFTGMGSVYVYDTPVRDLLLSGKIPIGIGPNVMSTFTVFMDNWFMHLLFLVAGISAAFALRKRSGGQFMGERCNRLLLPLLLGTVFVVSIQSWFRAMAFGKFSGSYFAFFPTFFNGFYTGPLSHGNLDYGQLWFLLYLFVFSAIGLPLFLAIQNNGENSHLLSFARRFSEKSWILLPALWIAFLEGLFRPGWPGALNLVNDWAITLISFSFFIFGYVLGKIPELLESIEKHRLAALVLGISAFLGRMSVYQLVAVPDGYNPANIAAQIFRGLAAYGLVMAAMGYGQRYLNKPGKLLGFARELSFPLYILHYAPLTAATYLLLNSGLSIWTRWALAVLASWSFVALFTFVARYIPLVRDFFSIRKPGKMVRQGVVE